jgi:hypothetical protein
MTFKNEEAEAQWKVGLANNTDSYGRCVFLFAEAWANMMEAEMGDDPAAHIKGKAKDLSHVASEGCGGITGFMYGAAVSILSQAWIHGEALRLWHNLDTQIGTEGERANESGGVLNPALLCVGDKP